MDRAEALERYRKLPLPDTTQEAWRFTDLTGFDPDAFVQNGHVPGTVPGTMLDIDVSALAHVGESGIEIERAPDGVTFEPLGEHERLGSLVGPDGKFTAHNAASWQHGLLVRVPKGVELEQPLYVRVSNAMEGGSLFWRLLVIAEAGSRFSLIEEYASSSPELAGYSNAVVELFVEQGAKLEYVSLQNLSRETWHFATHHASVGRDAELDWVAGGFGSRKGKTRIQNDLAGQGATSRVTGAYFADGTQHLDYDTFQEHVAPNTTSDFAFKGALRDQATTVWRGMIRVEPEAQKTNAYQENRNLLLSPKAHADAIPGLEILANDVRCTHAASPHLYPALFESAAAGEPLGRFDILFAHPAGQLVASAVSERFLPALDRWWQRERVPASSDEACGVPFTGGWLVYLGYELGGQIEPRLQLPQPVAGPIAQAIRVPAAVVHEHDSGRCWIVAEPGAGELIPRIASDLRRGARLSDASEGLVESSVAEDDPRQYLQAVERALEYIGAGDIYQANLSRGWRATLRPGVQPHQIYRRLRQTNPGPFSGVAQLDGISVISSSPERLVSVRDGSVTTRPIAGTRPRGADPEADLALARELHAHPKERAEHVMLIDLERNDLGRVCEAGTVSVDEFMTIESYSHVHHIVSNVRGRLRADITSLRGRHLPPPGRPALASPWIVRAVPGPQDDAFPPDALETFFAKPYEVTPNSDRMGIRLNGPRLPHRRSADILSDAIPLGAVQVPGEGQPIVLLADRQTTGGYAKIATAIGPDLPALAQARPGESVRFVRVTVEEAHAAVREAAQALARLEVVIAASAAEREYAFTLDGQATRAEVQAVEEGWLVAVEGERHLVGRPAEGGSRVAGAVLSPLPGLVVAVHVREGEAVGVGARLLTLSAMKMEHDLTAPMAGRVAEIRVRREQPVAVGDLLVRLDPSPPS